jgi:hypothetical protein
MNRKQLGLLIVVCLVVGGVGLFLSKRKQEDWAATTHEMGQKLIKDFPVNEVTELRIVSHEGAITIARTGDEWVVKERGNYPANFNEVTDLLRKVWDLKVAQPVQVTSAQLGRLELLTPDKGVNSGTLVEFKDKNGKTLSSLLLGKKHMKESPGGPSPFGGPGGGSFPAGRYVMVGNDAKTAALLSDALANIEPKPEQWLNKDFLKVEKPKSITVTSVNPTNNWKISRESESGEWKLADAKPGEKLDAGKSSSVTGALGYPSFSDVATNSAPDVTGMDKPVTAVIETFDGFTYTVKVGAKTGEENYFAQVNVAGNFPKERPPVKDEKPEDKEKADKEFKEKTAKLEERLKTDQAYAKWTYVVSKWTVDPFLKERKDFMEEKKDEPKKDESKPAVNPADSLVPKLDVK